MPDTITASATALRRSTTGHHCITEYARRATSSDSREAVVVLVIKLP